MDHRLEETWRDLKITSQFIKACEEQGFAQPTPVQKRCVPQILAGQKVIGIAQTGTGKTAAYLLPILNRLKFAQGIQPRVLILAPTKELVIQIGGQCRLLSKYSDLRTVELFGGVGPKAQIEIVKSGVDVMVATPGRFQEIYKSNVFSPKLIKILVIDEADRMMDMNFAPQIRSILEVLPPKRQDLLFSATFSKKVEKLVNEFIDFPMKIEITPQSSITKLVSQCVYKLPNFKTKLNLLLSLLKSPSFSKVMVFARTKENVINLSKFLERSQIGEVRSIHSNKDQNARLNSLKAFKDGIVRILVSTDVSARGIDVKEVTHVINFDVPVLYEDYTHRIGRTGRAFSTGQAITFATPSDLYHIAKIESNIGERIQEKDLPPDLIVEKTPSEEAQKIARELDKQKRIIDPTFKGAFHERKT